VAALVTRAALDPASAEGEAATLLGWLFALPSEVRRERPHLWLDATWALVFTNPLDLAEQWILELEKELDRPPAGMEAAPPAVASQKAEIMAIRALIATQHREVTSTIGLTRAALESLPARHPHRAVLALTLGYAHAELGDAEAADAAFAESAAVAGAAKNLLVATIATTNRAQLKLAPGRLRTAADLARQAKSVLAEQGGAEWPLVSTAEVGLGLVLCEWNDLEGAAHHVLAGVEHASRLGSVVVELAGDYALARLRWAQGNLPGALAALTRGRERLVGRDLPNWCTRFDVSPRELDARPVRVEAAVAWTEERDPRSTIGAWSVFLAEQLTRARTWVALRPPEEAATILAPVRRAEPDFLAELLHAVDVASGPKLPTMPLGGSRSTPSGDPPPGASRPPPVEPLTEREREVLRLIASGASNREIAAQLVVRLGTVKKHGYNLFGKLGVTSRTQAIVRARSLGMLSLPLLGRVPCVFCLDHDVHVHHVFVDLNLPMARPPFVNENLDRMEQGDPPGNQESFASHPPSQRRESVQAVEKGRQG
jgi:LuxR family transcriptional regulator, maltose regulon positive regulatory protein